MPQTSPLIELRNVVKRYPLDDETYYQALGGVSLTIKEGEFIAIMGPSGSGKSTLMHILGALDTATEGKQLIKGKDISSYTPDQLADIRNREIGFVFQSFNLLPRTTVFKNVERPMLYGGIPKADRADRIMKALEKVHIAEKADNVSNHISGGEIQRVAIARAIIMNPPIILADEPTGNLDTKTSAEIMKLFQELHKKGRTVIIVTHDIDIAQYAKRWIKIIDGNIVSDEIHQK